MESIHSPHAPKALGPYSQAIKSGEFLFVSGQLPIDIHTGKLSEGSMQTLTKKVLDHLQAILEAGGSSFAHVVRVDVFMTDLKEFSAMNEEYAKTFKGPHFPARQTIQVAALPLGSSIEISCIARLSV